MTIFIPNGNYGCYIDNVDNFVAWLNDPNRSTFFAGSNVWSNDDGSIGVGDDYDDYVWNYSVSDLLDIVS